MASSGSAFTRRTVVISGGGIAGLTLAYWLHHHGLQPTIVEQAPHLRAEGYEIDFAGSGWDVAARMRLIPALRERQNTVPWFIEWHRPDACPLADGRLSACGSCSRRCWHASSASSSASIACSGPDEPSTGSCSHRKLHQGVGDGSVVCHS